MTSQRQNMWVHSASKAARATLSAKRKYVNVQLSFVAWYNTVGEFNCEQWTTKRAYDDLPDIEWKFMARAYQCQY